MHRPSNSGPVTKTTEKSACAFVAFWMGIITILGIVLVVWSAWQVSKESRELREQVRERALEQAREWLHKGEPEAALQKLRPFLNDGNEQVDQLASEAKPLTIDGRMEALFPDDQPTK